ncbi:sodium-coupled monocarboxylate transporter 1 [Elysia marginata]|uniref:Sodium-coupled monocarboxylate transporter 1 n=1 Tax=Elysia marginata TaxID=1093978 RepID=A0AAV4G1D2_9GAST|nr:sodium-coupled monocarboxylate transporter 1 [Elysia marginata]
MKAVIWTDVFQAVVMLTGTFAILIQGTVRVGGPTQVWNMAAFGGRLNFFNFDPDPRVRHTFWNLFVASFIRSFGLFFNQNTVQRIASTKSLEDAKRMIRISAPCLLFTGCVVAYEGVVVYSYFNHKGCDPLASKQISNPNQLVPFTVMDMFSNVPGMPGLFLASLFSASLSTLSSGLASLAALTWADIVHPLIGEISEVKATVIIKFIDEDSDQTKHPMCLPQDEDSDQAKHPMCLPQDEGSDQTKHPMC